MTPAKSLFAGTAKPPAYDGPAVLGITSSNPSGDYAQGDLINLRIEFSEKFEFIFPENKACRGTPNVNTYSIWLNNRTALDVSSFDGKVFEYRYLIKDDASRTSLLNIDPANPILWVPCGLKASSGKIYKSIPLPVDKNDPRSLPASKTIRIVGRGVKIINVTSPNPDGTYQAGDTLEFHVTLEKRMFLIPEAAKYLHLEVKLADSSYRQMVPNPMETLDINVNPLSSFWYLKSYSLKADYVSGSGEKTFVFRLTLPRMIPFSVISPSPNPPWALFTGGMEVDWEWYHPDPRPRTPRSSRPIYDDNGYGIDTVEPVPTVERNKKISVTPKIDLFVGKVINVRGPSGSYGPGSKIPIEVEFDRPVVVEGVPHLLLNQFKNFVSSAPYVSGSGTEKLIFLYEPNLLELGESYSGGIRETQRLDYASTIEPLTVTPGFIKDLWYEYQVSEELGQSKYKLPEMKSEFNQKTAPVPGIGLCHRDSTVCTEQAIASRKTVPFFACGASCSISDRETRKPVSLKLPPAGQRGSLGFNSQIKITNSIRPRITEIKIEEPKTIFKKGDRVTFSVFFNRPVKVDGSPSLLIWGNNVRVGTTGGAWYMSGSGTNRLTFEANAEGTFAKSAITVAPDYGFAQNVYDFSGNKVSVDLPFSCTKQNFAPYTTVCNWDYQPLGKIKYR